MFFSTARCHSGDFQDHGSEGEQTMVQDHGFARVGTMQVQAIMPPPNKYIHYSAINDSRKAKNRCIMLFLVAMVLIAAQHINFIFPKHALWGSQRRSPGGCY